MQNDFCELFTNVDNKNNIKNNNNNKATEIISGYR